MLSCLAPGIGKTLGGTREQWQELPGGDIVSSAYKASRMPQAGVRESQARVFSSTLRHSEKDEICSWGLRQSGVLQGRRETGYLLKE